jgi:hypothetical protein
MSYRSRTIAGQISRGHGTDGPGYLTHQGTFEEVESEPNDLSLLGKIDCGGPFRLHRDRSYHSFGKIVGDDRWDGSDVVISFALDAHPTEPTQLGMWAQGATAISRCEPTAPIEPLLQTAAETYSDGLPSMVGRHTWRERALKARNAGHEFLNIEFGWLPLLSDIQNFAHAVINGHKIISDFRAGSGRNERVGYAFPTVTSTQTVYGDVVIYHGASTSVATATPGTRSITTSSRTWFKGCFSYFIPVGDDVWSKGARYTAYADKLLGLKVTPEVLWNIAPWSWADDWFGNFGDVLHNVSAIGNDGLVLKYGYIMSQAETNDLVTSSTKQIQPGVQWTAAQYGRDIVYKRRFPSSPYGFGVSDGSLSAVQKAIIGALGLTHGGHR